MTLQFNLYKVVTKLKEVTRKIFPYQNIFVPIIHTFLIFHANKMACETADYFLPDSFSGIMKNRITDILFSV